MATYRSWVFETEAPLDAFRYWFYRYLREAGWAVEEAAVYDREIEDGPRRAHLRLGYHDDGVLLEAKIRTGIIRGSAADVADALLEAGRRAQTQVQDRDQGPAAGADQPNR